VIPAAGPTTTWLAVPTGLGHACHGRQAPADHDGRPVPEELHDRLRAAAEERDFSVNFMVVKAVEEFLDRLIPADQLRLTRD
jgi:hypothetical protein